jgi:hypothetical protein
MKILLDNCVHYKVKQMLLSYEVKHARDMNWRKLTNGVLIAEAAKLFDVLVTTDKKIRFEHNLSKLPISILELNSLFTRFGDLQKLQPHLANALALCKNFRFVSLNSDGKIETIGSFPEAN